MRQRAFLGLAAVAAIAVPVTLKVFEAEPPHSAGGILTMGGDKNQNSGGILDMFSTQGERSDGNDDGAATIAPPKPADQAGRVAQREVVKAKPAGQNSLRLRKT